MFKLLVKVKHLFLEFTFKSVVLLLEVCVIKCWHTTGR